MSEDKAWERMQIKTFTRWANKYLGERKLVIHDLKTDLSDGVLLANLLEVIGNTKISPFNKNPRLRVQKLENINACLEFLKKSGVKLVGIGAGDIEEGNMKLILGLLWTTILRFQISPDVADGGSAKRSLLDWVNRQIKPYEREGVLQVSNFTKDWQDGKALAALTDSLRPGVINVKQLNDPLRDTENAIGVAEREYGIPPIVDAADVVNNPDEHSMMTYISYFRDYLENQANRKKQEEAERARRLAEEAKRKAEAVARAQTWRAFGPGVERGFRNRELPFTLQPNLKGAQAHASEFQVLVSHKEESLFGHVHEAEDGKFNGTWRGHEVGEHLVEIRLGGELIANAPFKVQLAEPSSAARSYAEGPGLLGARDDKPAHFTVYCKDEDGKPVPGEDALRVTVEYTGSDDVGQVSIKDNKDGSYSVEYKATRPGDVVINVAVDGQPIKDMPVNVRVLSGAEMDDLVRKIDKARTELDLPKRQYTEDELTGPRAPEERKAELKELQDLLAQKKQVDPIVAEINKLRKHMDLPPKQYTNDELRGPNAVRDRQKELDHLQKMVPIFDDIKQLRTGLDLPKRKFEERELVGPTTLDDRAKERADLHDVGDLVKQIQALRKKLDLPPKTFTEQELAGPTAVQDRTKERDQLQKMVPLAGEIQDLHKALEMGPRVFKEAELTGPHAIPEREKERDDLLARLAQKRQVDPLVAEIQKLRKGLDLAPKEFNEAELHGPTAVKDRTEERDNLKKVTPIAADIQDLRKQLQMPHRDFKEGDLTGRTGEQQRTAVAERAKERDELMDKLGTKQAVDPILAEIQALRKHMDLPPREWTEKELQDLKGRVKERDHLKGMVELHDQIHELRKQLGYPRREFKEDELTGPTSTPDRTKERDDLLARLERKKQTEPLAAEIQKLRKALGLPPREFTDEDLTGPTAVPDRTAERDGLKAMVGVTDEIQAFRKELEKPAREFARDELEGPKALAARKQERDALAEELKRKHATDPIIAEINKLRKQVDLPKKEFTEEERFGPTAVKDRTAERDQLKEVVPLAEEIQKLRRELEMPHRDFKEQELTGKHAVPERKEERDGLLAALKRKNQTDPLIAEIQKLRAKMDLPRKEFTEAEISGPKAVQDRTAERDQLKGVLPLYEDIGKLRAKLEMPRREYAEPELTGPKAIPDRTKERDELAALLEKKKLIDPIVKEIQKLRKAVDLPPKHFTTDELEGPTAVEDRTKERDGLRQVVPLADDIQRLRKKLEMPRRDFAEAELCGPTAVGDRRDERDELQDRLDKKNQLEPIIKEIQKLRKQLDLPPRQFTDDELYGPTAVEDRTRERDQLRAVVPLVGDIERLRKGLEVSPRRFEEPELCGEGAVEERENERDRLAQVGPLANEIQDLRKQLEMPRRNFDEEELVGPTAVEDREAERDELLDKLQRRRLLQPLIDELQALRKELGMEPRVFEDGELDQDDIDQKLQQEIEDLKRLLNRRDDADKLAAEIQELRKLLGMPPREFTEEELNAKDAVPKLTKERDALRDELERRNAVGDLPEQIQKLREILGHPPRKFPAVIPIEMVPELIEERDDLLDECEQRKKRAKELLDKIEKLWNYLEVPKKDRPDLSLKKDEVPSKKWLARAEQEYDHLRDLMRDKLKDAVAQQKELLEALWEKLHVPEDERARFYRNLGDPYTEEGLLALENEVKRLHQVLLSSKKIIKLIQKRKAFIQTMLEFEAAASDPRRLFKNSKQLNREEEFRRTAYPTLLKLEDAIREALAEFEQETGQGFMWEGEYYLVTLERDIEDRGLNLEMFGVAQGKKGRKEVQKKKIDLLTQPKKPTGPAAAPPSAASASSAKKPATTTATGARAPTASSAAAARLSSPAAGPKSTSNKGGSTSAKPAGALPSGFKALKK